MKGKRNEASQPRLDIIFSTKSHPSRHMHSAKTYSLNDIGLDPDRVVVPAKNTYSVKGNHIIIL